MQSVEETESIKIRKTRPKSPTHFSEKLPSYVVAFSLKETYDDLITAQQMICNKKSPQERSPQESTNSITPTNSLKMFETEQAEKLNQIIDVPENDIAEEVKGGSQDSTNFMESITPTNSLKYLSSADVSDATLVTISEYEKIAIDLSKTDAKYDENENTVKKKSDALIKNALSVHDVTINNDNKNVSDDVCVEAKKNMRGMFTEELTAEITSTIKKFSEAENTNRYSKENMENENCECAIEPVAIFQASKSHRKGKKKKKNAKRRSKSTVTIRQNNFKYKNPKKIIDNRLVKYYEKRNFIGADQIQKELYSDEVSTIVSRTRVLHKIIARENLLEESEFKSFINDVGLNEYDNQSVTSSISTAKKSIVSNSSQNTLTQKASTTSSKIEHEQNAETVNSVIKMPIDKGPYKTDVINVAVAVAYNRSKVNTKDETVPVPSADKFIHLTSSEMVTPFMTSLTSDLPSRFEDFKAVTIETSDRTLTNKRSSFDVSSNDFVIARTSSDFTKSSDESTYTLRNKIETVVDIETPVNNPAKDNTPTLLETVINLGIYPEMTPSTSSDTAYENDYNNVIITKNLNNTYQINPSKGDNKEQEISKNILRKTLNQPKDKINNKNINLPNQAEIKALLKDTEMPQMKCAEEARHPSYLPEMWERLVMTLEVAVKRLEDNLVEKINNELKNILGSYLHKEKEIPLKVDTPIEIAAEIKLDAEQGLQCDLVKNTTIDQIMRKLSIDGSKVFEPVLAVKSLPKSKLFKDFEVLKHPTDSQMAAENGDTVTVSTVTYEHGNFRRFKTLFEGPFKFVRENVFVISSVPTFFVVLLCVYGLILFLMKP